MTTTNEVQDMEGRAAVDRDGAKLGKIGQVYLDDESGQPLWVTIHTGMFGTKESFAPLFGSRTTGDNLQLAVTKNMVKDAPGIEADGRIEGTENEALYTYYEGYLGDSAQAAPTQDAMTRSEERLHVGTEQAEHEVTLHAERPVTEDHEVSESLRKEQIDDLDTDGGSGTKSA